MGTLATPIAASHDAAEDTRRVRLARTLKLFADPTRLHLLELLRDGHFNVAELAKMTGLRSPTVSHHLRLFCDAGIVELTVPADYKPVGYEHYYAVIDHGISQILNDLQVRLRLEQG